MATTPPNPLRLTDPVKFSERAWSDEVGLARAMEGPQPQFPGAYEFSNGRRTFEKTPYEDPPV
jgi:hypothetical protein